MTRAAMDALDAWMDLRDAALTPDGMDYLAALNREMRATSRIGFNDDSDITRIVYQGLSQADVYSPRPDVMDLVDGISGSVPYHPVLSSDELPSPFGFVYLPRPIIVEGIAQHTDGTDGDVAAEVRAFQWWETTIQFHTANAATNDPGELLTARTVGVALYVRDVPTEWGSRGRLGRWCIPVIFQVPADQQVMDRMSGIADRYGFGVATRMAQGLIPEDNWGDARFHRWLLSFWGVVREQQIADVTEEAAPRATRRRIQRHGGTPVRDVKVVDLRRRKHSGSTATAGSVDWSHRWPVRPHWRHQWYPSVGEHRLKLIPAYIKGPEDKPLIVKSTVFDVKGPT